MFKLQNQAPSGVCYWCYISRKSTCKCLTCMYDDLVPLVRIQHFARSGSKLTPPPWAFLLNAVHLNFYSSGEKCKIYTHGNVISKVGTCIINESDAASVTLIQVSGSLVEFYRRLCIGICL